MRKACRERKRGKRSENENSPKIFPEFIRALERERRILETLSADFFDRMETGIGHEDFTPDNMLFFGNEVSAILDFDRSQYGYRLHDVGRAILSFALKDGEMDLKKAYAFLEGYGEWMAFGEAEEPGLRPEERDGAGNFPRGIHWENFLPLIPIWGLLL